MRTSSITRNTAETQITLTLNLDGTGKSTIDTGVGFLDHMLTLFAKHGRFDLEVQCNGDTYVDAHHTTEDIGIALGEAFADALGDKRGIVRYGSMLLPMDETLILSAADLSGRAHLQWDVELPTQRVGNFDTELATEFFLGCVRKAEMTLHIRELSGENSHHIIEGIFKSVARTLKEAVAIDESYKDEIPSTKGVL
ncbi:MAG: imidazoleglycerol-phosphate dehydratase HisB [Clostridia bacterium]|nr:imidazoleglycerol-phosphate dehydratase HisB [Clostridia bacterium]